jgi:hypothetical protein
MARFPIDAIPVKIDSRRLRDFEARLPDRLARRQGVLSSGPSFCSTEQALDIQVETPSFGKIQAWSRNQTTMNPTIHNSSVMTFLVAFIGPVWRSDGPPR